MTIISKLKTLNIGAQPQFVCQNLNTENKKITRNWVTLPASAGNFKALADVSAVVNDCREIMEKNFHPFNEILTKVKEVEDLVDELKTNAIISFFKIN